MTGEQNTSQSGAHAPSDDTAAQHETVVLLHGLWMRGWAMTLLAQRLRGCGFTVVHYSYLSLGRTVSENAASLNALLTSLNAPTVHLVGHSLGGLVILRLLQDYPTQQAGRVVLLGTPYASSYVARTVAGHAATRWLLGKSFDGGLRGNGPQWAGGRELGVIAGSRSLGLGWLAPGLPRPNDGTVAVMETRVPGASGQIVLPVSHTGMLFSAPVAGAVCDFLQNGRFNRDPHG
ncbi:MAG: alpha/beta hydrolase [Gammaproteobacteria bacterium]